jgi:mannose-6-phosphate isomerase-like protein (cupin superfamily)
MKERSEDATFEHPSGRAAMEHETRVAESTGSTIIVGAGEGTPIWFVNSLARIKATARSTGGAYGLLESVIPPGFSPPLHVHHREDESFWVLEGEFTFLCGGNSVRALPGTYVFLPRGVPHSFVVEGDAPGRLLTMLTPGGGEGFFIEAGRPAEQESLPPSAPVDVAMLQRVARKFDMELVGPPMQRRAAAL